MYRSDAVTLPDPLKTVSPNSSFSFSGSLLDLSLSDVPLGSVSGNKIWVGGWVGGWVEKVSNYDVVHLSSV